MRSATIALCLLPLACAADPMHRTLLLPDWSGPPVTCRHRGDGGVAVELLAPTAGHVLRLVDATVDGARADVHLEHRPPGADFVAQVITPLTVEVPPERLGAARVVCIWVAGADGNEQLAVAIARPPR